MLQTGQTTSYGVISVPYAPPYPFTGGTPLFIGIDDIWSGVITLPFNFCYYGNIYNQIIIGANGLISFDLSFAGGFCEWQFGASIPTPGPPPGGIYNNSINGAYHDMDPSIPLGGNDINYAVLGSAPCRTFVINWYDVPHFQCNTIFTTQQIVLYETTNVIEVYILDKPTCFSWNSGNAVIGIQDATGTNGLAAPARNTGPWTASNEAWRFTPDGPPNFAVTWYEGVNVIGNGDSLLVCPITTTDYIVEVVYTNCDNSQVTVYDTITVFATGGGYSLNDTVTNASCYSTSSDGSATVTPAGGTPPFTYLWDVAAGSQTTATATGLGAGTYSVTVTDSSGCMAVAIITIGSPPALNSMIADTTMETCTGSSDGSITISTSGGTPFYAYNWSVGGTDSVATGLGPGTYYVTITDANGCDTVITVDITTISSYIVNLSDDDTICPGTSSFLSASGGTIYNWSTGATTPDITVNPQSTATYTVTVSDGLCTTEASVTVVVDPSLGPSPDFEADPLPTAKVNETVDFTDLSSFLYGTIISWNWDFGDGNSSSEQNPQHSYPMPGAYTVTLTVTGDNGCVSTVTLDYTIIADPIIVPNVFTPNGDNLNDFLIFKNLEYYGIASLVIFNRWGNKIYESGNYQNDWDGENVVNGVYFYILGVPELEEPITGHLTVIGIK